MRLQRNESWDIIDSSKIQTYMTCPRKYFFRYILGWRPDTLVSNHLSFGKAIHLALEHLSLKGYSDQEIATAYELFLQEYRKEQPPEYDDDNSPKNPEGAMSLLLSYANKFAPIDVDRKVRLTEVGGYVALDEDVSLAFRIDRIDETKDGIVVVDYKTGSRRSEAWTSQWSQKTQIGTYVHAAICFYGLELVWGAEIRGMFIYKTKPPEFDLVRIRKHLDTMEDWRQTTVSWVRDIKRDTERVLEEHSSQIAMHSFRKNTENCSRYGLCPYFDICYLWSNPLGKELPEGYVVDWWNPADYENVKHKVNLEWRTEK